MVSIGCSDVDGSWNTIAISLPRRAFIARAGRLRRFLVPYSIVPLILALIGCRPHTVSPVIDFPDPDSPAKPVIFPAGTSKLIPRRISVAPIVSLRFFTPNPPLTVRYLLLLLPSRLWDQANREKHPPAG